MEHFMVIEGESYLRLMTMDEYLKLPNRVTRLLKKRPTLGPYTSDQMLDALEEEGYDTDGRLVLALEYAKACMSANQQEHMEAILSGERTR